MSNHLYSQTLIDSRGKDFWFTFIPNYHNDQSSEDSVIIYIAADRATSGKIEYRDKFGMKFVQNFNITNDEGIYTFALHFFDFELFGINTFSNLSGALNDCEQKSPLNFHVTSQDDISVFCLQSASNTNDAFMSLPTHALSNEYMIMSYPSDGRSFSFGQFGDQSTPSQFAILATEDFTNIKITPTCPTARNKKIEQNIQLMKGESYLVQAEISSTNLNYDLTGSRISSDKAIAIFSGHQRTQVPMVSNTSDNVSRDMLVEQLFPLKSWGRNAFLIPFAIPQDQDAQGEDQYRILANYDKTKIDTNGVYYTTLNSGEFITGDLVNVLHVEANKPILVATYKKTAKRQGMSNDKDGDPFMMLIPPKEQFSKVYLSLNMQAYTNFDTSGAIRDQYMTGIVPNTSIGKVYLDDVLLDSNIFIKMGISGYSYTILKVSSGTHTLKSDTEIGVYIYGYGPVNSYGYIGGMSAKNNDYQPPKIFENKIDCYTKDILYTDTAQFDSGITELKLISNTNCNVQIPSVIGDIDSLRFQAKLLDPYKDGLFSISIKDSFGLSDDPDLAIPGFTVAPSGTNSDSNKIVLFEKTTVVGKTVCFDVDIDNYGNFTQNFDLVNQGKVDLTINPKLISNLTLYSQQNEIYTFCLRSDSSDTFEDTLFVTNNCNKRAVAIFRVTFMSDKKVPKLLESYSFCNQNNTVNISDNQDYDTGINQVLVLDSSNINLSFNIANDKSTADLKYSVKDPYQDANIKVIFIDGSNNKSIYERFIPGFTLNFTYSTVDFGKVGLNSQFCDTVQLTNYGSQSIIINDVKFAQNKLFSMPKSQLPVKIEAKQTVDLFVCFSSQNVTKLADFDTLLINSDCANRKIIVKAQTEELKTSTETRCGLDINFRAKTVISSSSFYFSNVKSNPILILENQEELDEANIIIYNSLGKEIHQINKLNLQQGEYQFDLTNLDLANGVYFAILNSKKVLMNEKFIINK